MHKEENHGSVLDAIKNGIWDFEPSQVDLQTFSSTDALPGSMEKLEVLAERLRQGLPLWHPLDRVEYAEGEAASCGRNKNRLARAAMN